MKDYPFPKELSFLPLLHKIFRMVYLPAGTTSGKRTNHRELFSYILVHFFEKQGLQAQKNPAESRTISLLEGEQQEISSFSEFRLKENIIDFDYTNLVNSNVILNPFHR
jgi:hypothetical protein